MYEWRYLCRNDVSSEQNGSFHDQKHILESLQRYSLTYVLHYLQDENHYFSIAQKQDCTQTK